MNQYVLLIVEFLFLYFFICVLWSHIRKVMSSEFFKMKKEIAEIKLAYCNLLDIVIEELVKKEKEKENE